MDELEKLKESALACRECPLCEGRTHVVFGTGSHEAELMFIGEGPGEQEDRRGEPFVGPAGQLLDDMLELIDIDRRDVYIANIVKCRPPRNRDPLGEEQAACRHYLESQLALIRPKLVVCLGRIAATALIRADFRITQEHGRWYEKDGLRLMAIYHPSALLRDPSKRPETFEDLRTLRATAREVCERLYKNKE